MKSRVALFALLATVLVLGRYAGRTIHSAAAPEPDLTVSGPYSHENLTIFLLHGPDASQTHNVLTLQEAIEQNLVVVHETGSVNELAVENKSSDAEVFIQSGDIVKGGRQDRLIASDLLLPPKSGVVPVPSFCVEQGRWSGRPGDVAQVFTCSAKQAPKALKLAVNASGQQGDVWKQVADTQTKLSANVGKTVNAPASPTSLQLALEDKDVTAKLARYEGELAKVLDGRNDVIGFAFAVNGKVEGADVYGSAALFRKLWPKLLRTAATDALAEFKQDQTIVALAKTDVRTFLKATSEGTQMAVSLARQSLPGDQFGVINRIPYINRLGGDHNASPRGRVIINNAEEEERQTGYRQTGFEQQIATGVFAPQQLTTGVFQGNPNPTGVVMGLTPAGTSTDLNMRVQDLRSQATARRGVVDLDGSVVGFQGLGDFRSSVRRSPSQPQPPVQSTGLRVTQTTNDRGLMVESRDRSGGAVIHRSFIAK